MGLERLRMYSRKHDEVRNSNLKQWVDDSTGMYDNYCTYSVTKGLLKRGMASRERIQATTFEKFDRSSPGRARDRCNLPIVALHSHRLARSRGRQSPTPRLLTAYTNIDISTTKTTTTTATTRWWWWCGDFHHQKFKARGDHPYIPHF